MVYLLEILKQKKRIKLKMYFPVMSYIIVDLNI